MPPRKRVPVRETSSESSSDSSSKSSNSNEPSSNDDRDVSGPESSEDEGDDDDSSTARRRGLLAQVNAVGALSAALLEYRQSCLVTPPTHAVDISAKTDPTKREVKMPLAVFEISLLEYFPRNRDLAQDIHNALALHLGRAFTFHSKSVLAPLESLSRRYSELVLLDRALDGFHKLCRSSANDVAKEARAELKAEAAKRAAIVLRRTTRDAAALKGWVLDSKTTVSLVKNITPAQFSTQERAKWKALPKITLRVDLTQRRRIEHLLVQLRTSLGTACKDTAPMHTAQALKQCRELVRAEAQFYHRCIVALPIMRAHEQQLQRMQREVNCGMPKLKHATLKLRFKMDLAVIPREH